MNVYIHLDTFCVSNLPGVKLDEFISLEEQYNPTARIFTNVVGKAAPNEITFVVKGSLGRLLRSDSRLVTVLVREFGFTESCFKFHRGYGIIDVDFQPKKVILKPGDQVFSLNLRSAYELFAQSDQVKLTPDNIFHIRHWKVKEETLPEWARVKLSKISFQAAYKKDRVLKIDDQTYITVVPKERGVQVSEWDWEPYWREQVVLIRKGNDSPKIIFETHEYPAYGYFSEVTVRRLHISKSRKSVVITTEEFLESYEEEEENLFNYTQKTHPILLSEILK